MGVMGSPESVASPACSCGGPVARLRAGRPRSQGVALGAMFLGARASCPQRAEGPQSADRSDTPEPGPLRPRRPMPSRPALGALPRTGAGEARERGRRPLAHVAGLRPACGRDARAPRVWPWERCPWERGHLARNGPKARKAATRTTHPSRPPAPEAPNAVEVGLGCPAEDGRWSSPRAWRCPLAHVAGLWPACGRDARAPRGWPCERCSWERGHLARIGPKARKALTEATHPSRPPRPRRPMPSRSALGALPRTGTGEARERGVARLAMWRACGPLAGGTPALPGCGPVSDVPGSAGILPAPGRRPAKRRQERHARAGPPAGGA